MTFLFLHTSPGAGSGRKNSRGSRRGNFLRSWPARAWCIAALSGLSTGIKAADLPTLWAERTKCVVAVEFYVESETERRPSVSYGTVIDDKGTIILPSVAINPRTTPSQLKEFKVYRPDNPASVPGEYLG